MGKGEQESSRFHLTLSPLPVSPFYLFPVSLSVELTVRIRMH